MLASSFTPVRDNLGQQIYQHLREQIYRMEIAPGSHLSISEIAAHLGVSRSPVRDALLMLVNEGVVEVNATHGYNVIELEPTYIKDAFVLRRSLELTALRLCMSHLDRNRIEQLRTQWLAFGDFDTEHLENAILADQQLHQAFAELSGNRLLLAALERITSVIWLISRFSYSNLEKAHYGAVTVQEHLHLLETMLTGDVEASVQALDQHLDNSCARSLERLDSNLIT